MQRRIMQDRARPECTLILLLAKAAFAGCDQVALKLALDAGETAFAARDKEGVQVASADVTGFVACQSEHIEPATASRVHGLLGMNAWLDQDEDTAALYFAAARAADLDYLFPQTAVPDTHPMRKAFDEASGAFALTTPLQQVETWTWFVDGRASTDLYSERPVVLQLDGPEEGLHASLVVATGQSPPLIPLPDAPAPVVRERRTATVGLAAGAAGLAATSGVLFGASRKAETTYYSSPSVADAESQQDRVNSLSVASGTSLGAAALLGGLAVVTVAF